jgi:hypothetical protein
MRTIRTHLTYANVISSLCLVLILGGGAAYAANTIFSTDIVDGEVKGVDIGSNEVRSSDVRDDTRSNGGLTSADIALGEVKTSDIGNFAVTNDQIGLNAITGNRINEAAVGTTALGFQAVQPLDLGDGTVPSKMYTKQASSTTDAVTSKEASVSCDGTDEVSGGGFVISNGGSNVPTVAIQRDYAVDSSTWLVRAAASSGTPTWGITVVANCVK